MLVINLFVFIPVLYSFLIVAVTDDFSSLFSSKLFFYFAFIFFPILLVGWRVSGPLPVSRPELTRWHAFPDAPDLGLHRAGAQRVYCIARTQVHYCVSFVALREGIMKHRLFLSRDDELPENDATWLLSSRAFAHNRAQQQLLIQCWECTVQVQMTNCFS